MKSYTDIEQSKKLAEILPIESADMHYCLEQRDSLSCYEIGTVPFINAKRFKGKWNIIDVQPAWSLSALLGVLPNYILQTNTDGTVFVFCESKRPVITKSYDNPIDACVAVIEKLHELILLRH